MKYGGKAMKGVGTATAATGKKMGNAALHPSQTLRGAGQAVKTATIGGAVGYVIDRMVDSRPFFLTVFLFLGGAAGILNVYRLAKAEDERKANKE